MLKIHRRSFLGSTAAALAIGPGTALASPTVLRSGPARLQILPKGEPDTALWGFNGATPGPELRLRQGERLAVRFENGTDHPSAIHWHGIRLRNEMDGVPGLTQPLVHPGEAFDYAFDLPDAGTYWYHSHHQSWEQVARGLYGPLIIEERNPPRVDMDVTVVLDDWRITREGALMEGFGNRHDFAHAGRLGNNAMIIPSQDSVRLGDRIRVRLINTATARVFPIRFSGLAGKVVALDGMPLRSPREMSDIELAPAQRIDLIGDVTGPVQVLFVGRDALYDMGSLQIEGENPDPQGTPIAALPAPGLPTPAKTPDHALTLRMQGGAMGGAHAGSDIWAFNGQSGLPDAPFARIPRGQTARIDLINDTAFAHGIHLHGHHFFELAADGTRGDLRDTTLLAPRAARTISAVFDNPGKWLLHCHMLGHQAAGMKTWIEVL